MKKKLLFLFACTLIAIQAQSQIVITEIMYNPPESGTDSLEYFELHNAGTAAVDLSGWNFTQGVEFIFPSGATIQPNAYITIAKSTTAFTSVFGSAPTYQWDNGALTNGGEDIELRDAAGNVMDYVNYQNGGSWPSGANGTGPSIVLCNSAADNDNGVNWQDCTTATGVFVNGVEVFGNPGAPSGCPSSLLANDDVFNAPEGESSLLNVLNNDFLPFPNDATVTILTGPNNGTASVNANNHVVYQPTAGFCGTDYLTYEVCDNVSCDTADVSINILCYPVYTIPQIAGIDANGVLDSLGVNCSLTATVYGVNLRPGGIQITIIDNNNNGIVPFSPSDDFGYTVTEGDLVTVNGVINQFNGLLQITVDTMYMLAANQPLVTPLVVTVPTEATESKLIKINNLHLVDPAEWTTGSGFGFNARAVSDDSPLDTIVIRIDNDVELFNEPAPTTPFNLTGLGGQFDSSNPYTSDYQIQPRYNADLDPIVGVKQADFSQEISIAPNPVSTNLTIKMDDQVDRIRIFYANGQLVRQINAPANQLQLPVEQLPAGVYYIQFEKPEGVWTSRVIKN